MPPIDQRVVELLRALRERIPRAPAWTEGSEGDPGITLAEVFAYLGDQLGTASTRLPAAARAELARLGALLVDRYGSDTGQQGGGGSSQPPAGEGAPVDPDDGTLTRNRYFYGRRLSADDFQLEQQYFNHKLKRLHRAAFRPGVIRGLGLSVADDGDGWTVTVSPGYALDPHGELIEVPNPVAIPVPDCSEPATAWVTLRYVERLTAPAPVVPEVPEVDAGSDAAPTLQPTRVVEGYAFAVTRERDRGAVEVGRLAHDGQGWRLTTAPPDSWDGDN